MFVPRRLYFAIDTGHVFFETGNYEDSGLLMVPDIKKDISTYTVLSDRNRNSFDVIELEYGQYVLDFMECSGYRINPQTKEIEFSYPDPNQPQQSPVYQEPLSEQVKRLKDRQDATENALLDFLLGGM